MDPNEAVQLALLAGETMLSYGAETYRVEDTMKRILDSCGFPDCESFAANTGLFASCKDADTGAVTGLKRVTSRSTDFERIVWVNEISRRFTSGEIGAARAIELIEEAKTLPTFSVFLRMPAAGLSSFCFTYMLGGALPDCLNALITGMLVQLILIPMRGLKLPDMLTNMASGLIITLLALTTLNLGVGANINKAIIGSLMPILPGLMMTNAIRDVVDGNFLSGFSRMMEAILTAIAIAVGVGAMLGLWINVFGGIRL